MLFFNSRALNNCTVGIGNFFCNRYEFWSFIDVSKKWVKNIEENQWIKMEDVRLLVPFARLASIIIAYIIFPGWNIDFDWSSARYYKSLLTNKVYRAHLVNNWRVYYQVRCILTDQAVNSSIIIIITDISSFTHSYTVLLDPWGVQWCILPSTKAFGNVQHWTPLWSNKTVYYQMCVQQLWLVHAGHMVGK